MRALLAVAVFVAPLAGAEEQTLFRIREGRLQVLHGGEVLITSPPEGLWSIACDWRDSWPADWRHAIPAETAIEGPWTIVRGRMEACGGSWTLQDAYRREGRRVKAVRRFTWNGAAVAPKVTLSVRLQTSAQRTAVLLPGIIYYGNPSGARSGRVPVYTGQPGEEALYEEHRFPMPFVSLELDRGGKLWGAALHALPSRTPHANLPDQWWSMGVKAFPGGTEMQLLSGPCASNGKRSVIKAFQRGFAPYDEAYLNVPPGGIVEKVFYLEAFPVTEEGGAFRQPLRTSLDIFRPYSVEDMPDFPEIIRDKWRYAKTRWREDAAFTLFQKYSGRNYAVMGWTGQAEAPGYALLVLADGLQDPGALRMAKRSLDFLTTATFYPGGFYNWYDINKRAWERQEILCQGQAMLAFARAIPHGRNRKLDTRPWEAFLRKAADLHSARILDAAWRPVSTNEAAFIAPLAHAFRLFGVDQYRKAAVKAAEHYAARHYHMREPYWGGTLDAQCEDKEGAAAAFQGFLELYELTKDPRHLRWARHAADVMLTYTVVWDIDMPAGRLRDHNLRTRGWTVVSPQNQHLDVWGVLTAPDVYRLGQLDGREDLKKLAVLMYRSCGQMIDPYGSQGEQLHHTNYIQRNQAPDIRKLRGDYNEHWTVFWITAHFLTGAARFAELGFPVWR